MVSYDSVCRLRPEAAGESCRSNQMQLKLFPCTLICPRCLFKQAKQALHQKGRCTGHRRAKMCERFGLSYGAPHYAYGLREIGLVYHWCRREVWPACHWFHVFFHFLKNYPHTTAHTCSEILLMLKHIQKYSGV